MVKDLPAHAGDIRDAGLIPGLGRSPGGGLPTPVFLPGEAHGQRSLAGCSRRVAKSQTRIKQLITHICITIKIVVAISD